MIQKTSIRYFNEAPVRAAWDAAGSTWFFSAVDIIAALVNSKNPRIYWNTCKTRNPELNTFCRQLRLTASDGKSYMTDCLSQEGVDALLLVFMSTQICAKNRLKSVPPSPTQSSSVLP
jgi:cell filamentation protein